MLLARVHLVGATHGVGAPAVAFALLIVGRFLLLGVLALGFWLLLAPIFVTVIVLPSFVPGAGVVVRVLSTAFVLVDEGLWRGLDPVEVVIGVHVIS